MQQEYCDRFHFVARSLSARNSACICYDENRFSAKVTSRCESIADIFVSPAIAMLDEIACR